MTLHRNDPFIGRVIGGQYRVDDKIGEGGMGAVYRATQLAVSRSVAIKVLRAHVPEIDKAALVHRFRREAMSTSKLRHPNTVSVYDFGETEDGTLYMVLELLDGVTLTELVERHAPLPPERVAYIGKQIAKSLAEAHECGIVHRDLKPDNIFICDYHGDADFTKVMDFGIARLLSGDDARDVTRTGMMVGTPRYIAPEQAMAKKVGPPADLYALGVILYEMLTGRAPFDEESAMALALAHINEPVPPLKLPRYPKHLAEGWQGLVEGLLTKNPKRRPQRSADVANWLAQLELDALRWREQGRSGRWTVTASSPNGEAPSTYEGPSPRSTVTVSRAARPSSSGAWVAVAAFAFMLLGGLFAFVMLSDEAAPAGATAGVVQPPSAASTRPAAAPPPSAASAAVPAAIPPGPQPAAAQASAPRPPPTSVVTIEPDPDPDPDGEIEIVPVATRLHLTSVPPGAFVHLGDDRLCATPCDLELDPTAEGPRVELRFTRRGYRDTSISVGLEPGQERRERVTLTPHRRRKRADKAGAGSLPALRLGP
ncbi:MAG: hypothetical protein CSA66_00225 [Proteobacteria bacterium]|nr:MAG: hypothetical protein CSA66_00225 [Pseudomonadota bacterium]